MSGVSTLKKGAWCGLTATIKEVMDKVERLEAELRDLVERVIDNENYTEQFKLQLIREKLLTILVNKL